MVVHPREAGAVEREWFVGGTVGYAFTDVSRYRWYDGAMAFGQARYGVTDALNLDFELKGAYYPKGSLFVPGALAGMTYVIDITRFVPEIGALAGVADFWTVSCGATANADGSAAPPLHPCGHDPRPELVIPAGFELRITDHFVFGAQFRYAFVFVGDITKEIGVGASFAFATGKK